jgi:hypothetical protein
MDRVQRRVVDRLWRLKFVAGANQGFGDHLAALWQLRAGDSNTDP